MTDASRLAPATLDAIAHGQHADPFSVLGLHGSGKERQVVCFFPSAQSVTLINRSGRRITEAEQVHTGGVFVAALGAARDDYRLRVQWPDGHRSTHEDAYRFSTTLGELDRHLLGEGAHKEIYSVLGAHVIEVDGIRGTRFAVWAPNASRVSVIGDFNVWDGRRHPMRRHHGIGIWEIFIPDIVAGERYKYELLDQHGQLLPLKSDPYGNAFEPAPHNASIVTDSQYAWEDQHWQETTRDTLPLDTPVSIYELHLGSWRRGDGNRWLTYRELAAELIPYVKDMGFTHIELLPVTEHPFDGSWGYQPIGLYAPTWRFGDPDDLRYFIDQCHLVGIGVIVDWVPAHFPRDDHGLARFDGTALYEHEDPRKGAHADWGTLIFNYGRREVINYLLGSAAYWIREFHVDGLRVDAVASMLYLDYSRNDGEWLPNEFGGNENLEAVRFLKQLNEHVHALGASTWAEESTAWPGVSKPTYDGGLGFTFKWNMGWMNDSLRYMSENPVHRRYHHDKITFGLVYAFDENFVLPLSHDEVVHGKRSLLGRMPGDDWQRFANLRAYYGMMFCHPGKKLLFMGAEFAQRAEWNHDQSLDWHLLETPLHAGMQELVRDLNTLYTATSALYQRDYDGNGFAWLDWQDADHSIFAWLRFAEDGSSIIAISNMTPVVRERYRVGVPVAGSYAEILNTDRARYGGSDIHNDGPLASTDTPAQHQSQSLTVTLPPLATIVLQLKESSADG